MVILTIAIAVLLGLIILWWLKGKQRTKGMEQAAFDLGAQFKGDIKTPPQDRFTQFRLFSHRVGGNMENTIVFQDNSLWIFDYEYTIPKDQTVRQTVAVLNCPGQNLPPVILERRLKERFTIAFGKMLTTGLTNRINQYREIPLPEHPAFPEKYRLLSSESKAFVLPLLTPDFLDKLADGPDLEFEARGQWLMAFSKGKRVPAREIPEFAETAQQLFAVFSG